jgi:hypothetical protein
MTKTMSKLIFEEEENINNFALIFECPKSPVFEFDASGSPFPTTSDACYK